MTVSTIRIPERDELANRLVAINGEGHMVRYFYPRLLDLAGHDVTPVVVVMELGLATGEYMERLGLSGDAYATVEALVWLQVPAFVRALVDDPSQRSTIRALFEEYGLTLHGKDDA